jgi:hypothetical protein
VGLVSAFRRAPALSNFACLSDRLPSRNACLSDRACPGGLRFPSACGPLPVRKGDNQLVGRASRHAGRAWPSGGRKLRGRPVSLGVPASRYTSATWSPVDLGIPANRYTSAARMSGDAGIPDSPLGPGRPDIR